MKKARLGITIGAVSTMILGTLACIVLPKAKDFNITGFATGEYTCALPDNTYCEISDVIDDIFLHEPDVAFANTHIFRGTVTKRFGDYAFIQRKNQVTHKIDAIKIKGLNSYGDDIVEGNVIDICGGNLILDKYTPTVVLIDTEDPQYNIAFNVNPFGYEPIIYEGVTDYFTNGFDTENALYSFQRYIKLNRVKLWEPLSLNNYDLDDGSYYGSSVYEYGSLSDEFEFIIANDDFDVVTDIYGVMETALTQNKLINIKGITYYHDNNYYLFINSVSDIEVTSESLIDTDVVTARTNVDFRWGTADNYKLAIPASFIDGYEDVPYVDAGEAIVLMTAIFGRSYPYYHTKEQVSSNVYRYVRTGEGYYEFDTANDIITIHRDVPYFGTLASFNNGYRIMSNGGETKYTQIDIANSVHHADYSGLSYNQEVTYDLGQFNLDIVKDKYDRIYVPMTVFADIISNYNNYGWAYNGDDMYLIPYMEEDPSLLDMFHDESPWDSSTIRSASMCEYTYNALCFSLKYLYGLWDLRSGMMTPDALLTSLGVKDDILSNDPVTYETGMATFAGSWLFEGHAGYTAQSPYTKNESDVWDAYYNAMSSNPRNIQLNGSEIDSYRNDAGVSQGVRFYNDMAIITFDSFQKIWTGDTLTTFDFENDDYGYLADNDTPAFFRKAFNEIETHPEVTNVIFDIALNTGGRINALPWLAAYVTSTPSLTMNYRLDGECDEIYYHMDINYDGVFDSNDTYQGQYNFYCLTSRLSFSCGNNFPTYLKAKGLATLIGEQSGGGLCAVGAFASACGTIFRNSSNMHICAWDDTHDVLIGEEDGVTPDLPLDRQYFYDDAAIYNLIHGI